MKHVKRFKISLAAATVWLACLMTYLFVALPLETAPTREALLAQQNMWMKCGGDIYESSGGGYYCDFYDPSLLLWGIILLGIIAFLAAIISFFVIRAYSTKSK